MSSYRKQSEDVRNFLHKSCEHIHEEFFSEIQEWSVDMNDQSASRAVLEIQYLVRRGSREEERGDEFFGGRGRPTKCFGRDFFQDRLSTAGEWE
jgi:hypothetical protein